MIFQQVLAQLDPRVTTLERATAEGEVADKLIAAWSFVLDEIDYVPIFTLARDILRDLIGNPGLDDALRTLAVAARNITARRAALRHDLMGRVYHRLLADAKYFGAYYTTIPAAALLLKLAFDRDDWSTDWSDVEQIKNLRIADLACGTGTLLKAALQAVADNHVRARAEGIIAPDLDTVHQSLVEQSLWGFDVIPFAIHLAGSALALHQPNVKFGDMNLRTMPLHAHPQPRLGSLDFIHGREAEAEADLFGAVAGPAAVTGAGDRTDRVEIPMLDLCVMNPPFTRSVGGNLLFGNLPARQRTVLQRHLKRLVAARGVPASITAGLGSVFVGMANPFIREGGHLALVLPRALLTGVAWEQTRMLIGAQYQVRYIIVSHQPGQWNFSENTSLSECLIVARKLRRGEDRTPTKVINLRVKPSTTIEALSYAEMIRRAAGAPIETGPGSDVLRLDNGEIAAEVVLAPAARIQAGQWGDGAAFAHTDLNRAAFLLSRGTIYVPGEGEVGRVTVVPFGRLGRLGPDRRDIHDGFRITNTPTTYAAFWGHATGSVDTMAQTHNRYLIARARAARGRMLRDANLLWSRAGRLLIGGRLRLNTARLVGIYLDRPVLSNTWWPVALDAQGRTGAEDIARILTLWFNSSLGVLSMIAARVDTEGAWVDLKKPILANLSVLDPRELSDGRRDSLLEGYRTLENSALRPLTEIHTDPVRAQIDDLILQSLGIPWSLAALRELIAAEPLFARAAEVNADDEEANDQENADDDADG
jgi:hypothetical protein